MKRILITFAAMAIALFIMMTLVVLVASAEEKQAPTPSQTYSPLLLPSTMPLSASEPDPPYFDWLIYKTREEFHHAVIYAINENEIDRTYQNIEDIVWYYDLSNTVTGILLDEIRVNSTYIALDYCDKEAREFETLMIRSARWDDVDEEKYIENTRNNARDISVDIMINGKIGIKQEVYWDSEFINGHICNQYYWVEDGCAMFVRVPTWLLERYPEETFFDIKKVYVQAFSDVNENDWFYDDVGYAFGNSLMTGTAWDKFSPTVSLSRGMIVTILYRHAGSPDASDLDNPFSDVTEGKYYTDAVKWAAENGIVLGYNGKFNPDTYVSRQDLAVILYRYSDFAGMKLPVSQVYPGFTDDVDIADYAKEAVQEFFKAQIINGKPGNRFDPKGSATRAEAAAMLHRFLESVEE